MHALCCLLQVASIVMIILVLVQSKSMGVLFRTFRNLRCTTLMVLPLPQQRNKSFHRLASNFNLLVKLLAWAKTARLRVTQPQARAGLTGHHCAAVLAPTLHRRLCRECMET